MIVIASSASREAALFASLCEHRNWPCQACPSVDRVVTLSEQLQPRTLVIRHRLEDGYSDDVLNFLKTGTLATRPRVIVLMPADATGRAEARQIELGADCVLRDPVRLEVLLQYIAKYRSAREPTPSPAAGERPSYVIANVEVFPHEQKIAHAGKTLHIAPQEVALLRILARSNGKVATYPTLYEELLSRKFVGDTTNCRVLLGKVCASFRQLGVDLKAHVQVIPKSGYLYSFGAKTASNLKSNGKVHGKVHKRRAATGQSDAS